MTFKPMKVKPLVELKVKCTDLEGGFPEHAYKLSHLELNNVYTVEQVLITDSYTFVWFKEIPDVAFNDIHFEVIGYKHLYDGVFENQMHLVTGRPVN